ncbi:MAG: DNA/RNA non-specific endonuclease [Bacteroidales bacterium]|nr:DNA/RNA non-specific endonuclease [Bacteroidales bacterium]
MKRIFCKIGLIAAVSAMLLGCAKDKSEPQPEVYKRTVKVSFTKGADTKTSLVEGDDKASYVWSEGDDEYFRIYENGTLGTITEIDYSADMKRIDLTVEFATVQADEYVYSARFAKEFSNKGNIKIQDTQSPGESSYDPDADGMITDEITSATALNSLQFMMQRIITVNKMTLKGLVPGEKIKRVEVTFDKIVTGYYVVSGDDAGTYANGGKKITLNYDDAVVPSDGTFPVYFTAMPVENAGFSSVVVSTDQNTYTKPESAFSGTLSFSIGKMTRFGMNMSGYATPVSTSVTYTLVQNQSGLVEGTYIIAASGFDKAMGGLSGTIHTSENITKTGNTIVLDNTSTVLPVKLKKNGSSWTIQNDKSGDVNYGNYLAWDSGNTSIEQADAYNWNISISSGVATIACGNATTRTLQYNQSSPRFCCYTSSQKPVALYIAEGSGPTGPAISITSSNPVVVGKAGGSQTASYTITNPVSGVTLTATSNASWITNVAVSGNNITFNVAAQAAGANSRTGTITLNYTGASSVELAVSQEPGEGGSQAINGWLELPASQTGSDYFTSTFFADGDRNYTYMYQYSMYTCLWVAYPLYASTMGSSEAIPGPYSPDPMEMASFEDRGKTWAANPQIDKNLQINVWSGSYGVNVPNANPSDLYARGHQIPNADRSNNGTMQSQTYYATNSTPQIQNRFNGYIWGKLEDGVRESVKDTVYVVTGACFRKVGGSETISYIQPQHDSKRAPVPNYYWKVLLKVKRSGNTITSAKTIGFWYEHKQYTTQDYSNSAYRKSVSQIEAWTGFNFFVNLPYDIAASVKNNTDWDSFKSF